MSTDDVRLSSDLEAVRDHSRSFAELSIVYPVISRRAGGLSLGINLNPDKRCSFNCAYCAVDRRVPGRKVPVNPGLVREELTTLVRWVKDGRLLTDRRFSSLGVLAMKIKDLAFSGDGEPTLASNFSDCVRAAADVRRAESLDQTKIVLITNATCLDRPEVKKGLAIMDANNGEVWAKLDAGTETWYRLINRSTVRFDHIVANILETARERPIVIQSLFLRVRGQTMPAEELRAYCERIGHILANGGQIKEIHAYTIARPVLEPWVEKLTQGELEEVADTIRKQTGLTVRSFP